MHRSLIHDKRKRTEFVDALKKAIVDDDENGRVKSDRPVDRALMMLGFINAELHSRGYRLVLLAGTPTGERKKNG